MDTFDPEYAIAGKRNGANESSPQRKQIVANFAILPLRSVPRPARRSATLVFEVHNYVTDGIFFIYYSENSPITDHDLNLENLLVCRTKNQDCNMLQDNARQKQLASGHLIHALRNYYCDLERKNGLAVPRS